MTKYKNAHSLMTSQTGFGISAQDQKDGIKTLADKQHALCPYYSLLDALFGQRQIQHSVIAEVGAWARQVTAFLL